MVKLNEIADNPGATKNRTRVGRGPGSGKGRTAGRGFKGQKSRSGVSINGFEGGQMPIYQRLPKRGFNNIFRKKFAELNVGRLQAAIDAKKIDAKKPLDAAVLAEAGVIRRVLDGIRLLGHGELTASITIEVAGATKSAVEAVEKAGGKVHILPGREKPEGKLKPKAERGGKAKKAAAKDETKDDAPAEAAAADADAGDETDAE
jgi:large subunit ribosomal protein L15